MYVFVALETQEDRTMAHYKGAASEGGRAMILMKKRQKEQEEVEAKKKKIEEELKIGNIQNKFATHYDAIEQQLKSNTIGNKHKAGEVKKRKNMEIFIKMGLRLCQFSLCCMFLIVSTLNKTFVFVFLWC